VTNENKYVRCRKCLTMGVFVYSLQKSLLDLRLWFEKREVVGNTFVCLECKEKK